MSPIFPSRLVFARALKLAGGTAARPAGDLRPHSSRVGAFTLLELMVVIVLIGITSAMILPEMRGTYDEAMVRAASRELLDTFNLAYSRAASLNQAHRVSIQESTGRYIVEIAQGPAGREFRPLRGVPGCEGKLDARISVAVGSDTLDEPTEVAPQFTPDVDYESESQSNANINFYPDGTADARQVRLKDSHGRGVALRINPVTARVSIHGLDTNE